MIIKMKKLLKESAFSKYYKSPTKETWLNKLRPKIKAQFPSVKFTRQNGFLKGNGKTLIDMTANIGDKTTEKEFIDQIMKRLQELEGK